MKICKFGGSSVASAEQIRKVISIVASDPARRVVVVSAPGKRDKDDTKVTDLLIGSVSRPGEPDCSAGRLTPPDSAGRLTLLILQKRFSSLCSDLGIDASYAKFAGTELENRINAPQTNWGQYMDAIKALGEEASARICAAAFTAAGIPARYVDPLESGMVVSDEFGNARLLPEAYGKLRDFIAPILAGGEIAVYPGFYGHTRKGEIATFSRGGSDITGAILAAALGAEVYENFTDVSAVYPIDPRIVPEVRDGAGITRMTYREMRELSNAGFGVFHDEAVLPAIKAKIPINIRNTNRPEDPGTLVLPERKTIPGRVIGVASTKGYGTICIAKYLMNREVGIAVKILSILADEGVPFEHMPTGVDSVSIILRDDLFTPDVRGKVFARIRRDIEPDELNYTSGLALIMVVGEGMRTAVGTCAKITRILADAGVNIDMINQGSSEISIMFGIAEPALETAVRALYFALYDENDGLTV